MARFAINTVDADNNGTLFYTAVFQMDLGTLVMRFYINDNCASLYPRFFLWEVLVKKCNQLTPGESDQRVRMAGAA